MTWPRRLALLFAGDLVARALSFLAFVHLARVLGVADYGVLEFAITAIAYVSLAADGGLEVWATGEVARGRDPRELAAKVLPLRLTLAVFVFGALLAALSLFPGPATLGRLLAAYGATLFTQATGLRWVFMGRERSAAVATGATLTNAVFALGVVLLVDGPTAILWVPVLRVTGDLAATTYFLSLFLIQYGPRWPAPTLRGTLAILRPALTLGAALTLGLLSYNVSSILLWFLQGPTAVGLYGAASKPVTIPLALSVTYFLALYPALARAHADTLEAFKREVTRSLRVASLVVPPFGVATTFLAEPITDLLFGPAYAASAPALRILGWSAVLVVLRSTYRHGLTAAGRARLDLYCAGGASAVNVGLNLLLIPTYGITGAALATVTAEAAWLTAAAHCFRRNVLAVDLAPLLTGPLAGAAVMAAWLLLAQAVPWPLRGIAGAGIYGGVVLLVGTPRRRLAARAPSVRAP